MIFPLFLVFKKHPPVVEPKEPDLENALTEVEAFKVAKPKEGSPFEEIKEVKNIGEALIVFNRHEGYKNPGLIAELAGKFAELGEIDKAIEFTKLAAETANSLRNQESGRSLEQTVGGFEVSINRMGQFLGEGYENANKITVGLGEIVDGATRAVTSMHYNTEQSLKIAGAIKETVDSFNGGVQRLGSAVDDFRDSVGRMRSGY